MTEPFDFLKKAYLVTTIPRWHSCAVFTDSYAKARKALKDIIIKKNGIDEANKYKYTAKLIVNNK